MSTKEFRQQIGSYTAMLAFIFGFALTIAGFIVPPLGVVHDSVLWILGQCLIYTGSIVGISTHYSAKLKEFESKIESKLEKK